MWFTSSLNLRPRDHNYKCFTKLQTLNYEDDIRNSLNMKYCQPTGDFKLAYTPPFKLTHMLAYTPPLIADIYQDKNKSFPVVGTAHYSSAQMFHDATGPREREGELERQRISRGSAWGLFRCNKSQHAQLDIITSEQNSESRLRPILDEELFVRSDRTNTARTVRMCLISNHMQSCPGKNYGPNCCTRMTLEDSY